MNKIKSFVNKHVHSHSESDGPPPQILASAPVPLQPFPSEQDFYRYRKQRGVNLGSWFVLERWITDAPYRSAAHPGESDHDVARGENGKKILENHWDEWVKEEDWKWLSERGINTVRIPIGFYHLCQADPSVLEGTDFSQMYEVFEGAWPRIVNAIASAQRYGIGVLIAVSTTYLHAVPGKQNGDSHSGTSSSVIAFFRPENLARTRHILQSLLVNLLNATRNHSPPLVNLVGVELVNEPNPTTPDHTFFHDWYRSVFSTLAQIDPNTPLYVGDSWRTYDYAGLIQWAPNPRPTLMALDHHLYRCFTQEDGSTPAAMHAQVLRERGQGTPDIFENVANTLNNAGAGLVVGEWSAALNPGSLVGVDTHTAQREFVDAQLALYERECAGTFFWTFKKQWGGDTGWGLRDAVASGIFPDRVGMKLKRQVEEDGGRSWRRDQAKTTALNQHVGWWSNHPGQYEHWRFEEGYTHGWEDAYLFFFSAPSPSGAVPEIGFKGAWVKRRSADHSRVKGNTDVWEYGTSALRKAT
ncbi:glycoside hydrolase [Amylostereum chailletii]|nr:glycoside hydrolase [Amylostereum chailletii]